MDEGLLSHLTTALDAYQATDSAVLYSAIVGGGALLTLAATDIIQRRVLIPSVRFLAVTVKHKFHVYQAGRRLGVGRWQLLRHDLSKFRPSEFVPYGKFFYSLPGATWQKAQVDKTKTLGMCGAWLRHIRRNPHHWQYWCLINGASVVATRGTTVETQPIEALPMPRRYVREMLADWLGAGRAYDGAYPESIATWKWWQQNKWQLVLHPETKKLLAAAILDWFCLNVLDPADEVREVWADPPSLEQQVVAAQLA
jgi:hypothetical protein